VIRESVGVRAGDVGRSQGATCMSMRWYELMEKSRGSGKDCRGRRRLCGDARGERY
jgi:hypothetical protein